jgi:hypothetical protein
MESMDDAAAEDALCLQIGRVARAHVALDNALRRTHQTLLSPSLGVYPTNRITSTEALITDCRLMLPKADIPEGIAEGGDQVLTVASRANAARNRVVHDMWLREPAAEGDPTWRAMRVTKGKLNPDVGETPRDLTFIAQVVGQVERAALRVSGLTWALWELLPFYKDLRGPESDVARWVAVMENRFELLEGGGFRITA